MRVDLSGMRALVTGAGRGIGRATALRLAQCGADVAVVDRNLASQAEVTDNIAGGAITPFTRSAATIIPIEDIRALLDVNLMATIYLCQQAAPALRASAAEGRSPAIINTSSLSATGVMPDGMLSGYALAKAAVAHYTRSLAEELGPDGVRANAVAPGYTMTERVRANSASTGFADKASDSALRRLATPEDIADAFVYLASPLSAYVTGQILSVDGATRLV